jgi:thiol:disulfide interchange protein DsbA
VTITEKILEPYYMNMKRREFTQVTAGAVLASTLLGAAQAQSQKPQAGKEYQVLDTRASVEAPTGKIELVEFFSYMCPHCNVFEPTFAAWAKHAPKDVVIRRLPVSFLQFAEVLQPMYFALEAMKLVDKLHAEFFTAVHIEHRLISTPAMAADWVASKGVDKAKFVENFNSFAVATKVARATQLTNAYKIDGVPAIGVAGRFLTEGTAKGLQIAEFLVGEVRAGR